MKKLITILILVSLATALGFVLGRWWMPEQPMTSASPEKTEREILYWKAPMDPNYRRDAPGKSPMGMDLVPVYADDNADDDPGVVRISPAIVNNLGVRTELAQKSKLPRRVETVAYAQYDENTQYHVSTRVDGWVEKLTVKATGDPVTQGQVLFELYSPALVNAQEEFLAALRSGNKTLQDASGKRLAALGVSASDIRQLTRQRAVRQRMPVTAKADGVITHLGVKEGMFIRPSTKAMEIAGLDSLWIVAEVFERQVAWVQPGQEAEVTVDYLPGQSRHAVVEYLYPELDPKTRTLKVRLRMDNKDRALRPNMFARVTIAGTSMVSVTHIPRQALIRGGRENRVVLALGDGKYRAQIVTPGMESGDRVAILAGLKPGDRVVTSGQFLIDSESNAQSALSRLTFKDDSDENTGDDSSGGMDHSGHDMDPGGQNMDHSGHEMEPGSQDMDHSGHDMEPGSQGMDHSGHEMESGSQDMDHSGHEMESGSQDMDHSGHEMESGSQDMDHSGHEMESGSQDMDHSGQEMDPGGQDMDHSGHDMEPGGQDLKSDEQDNYHGGHDMKQSGRELDHSVQDANHTKTLAQAIVKSVNLKGIGNARGLDERTGDALSHQNAAIAREVTE